MKVKIMMLIGAMAVFGSVSAEYTATVRNNGLEAYTFKIRFDDASWQWVHLPPGESQLLENVRVSSAFLYPWFETYNELDRIANDKPRCSDIEISAEPDRTLKITEVVICTSTGDGSYAGRLTQ